MTLLDVVNGLSVLCGVVDLYVTHRVGTGGHICQMGRCRITMLSRYQVLTRRLHSQTQQEKSLLYGEWNGNFLLSFFVILVCVVCVSCNSWRILVFVGIAVLRATVLWDHCLL